MRHTLPPGPWDSRGNKVVTGNGQTICVVFYPRYASEIARVIASLPDLIEKAEELESEVLSMEKELSRDTGFGDIE